MPFYRKRYALAQPNTMKCECGKDAAQDGYTIEIWNDKNKVAKPKGLRLCRDCYEYHVRQDWSKHKGLVSAVKGYHV